MANIRVALRVRPLTAREKSYGSNVTLQMDVGRKTVSLHKPLNAGEADDSRIQPFQQQPLPRQFSFDHCFWSADRSAPHFASQEKVFDELGMQVLDALLDGYNACVLAYGQSGTGKTYTMMGTAEEPGIAPRLCRALFDRMAGNEGASFRVDVSFMEIYNEKVRDLLDDKPSQLGKQLRVREHPKLGPYVQDLSRHAALDATAALDYLSAGLNRRTSAATDSNGHSSRSHAVFSVHCTAARVTEDGEPRETYAKLHLVDLAGSERANRESVSRLRLKEGSLINKSLATLGNVINALVERSSIILTGSSGHLRSNSISSTCSSSTTSSQTHTPAGSPRHPALRLPFVPYRDSVLTWILKDSLGGNARTFVIAAVSPSIASFKETLSTLRFAQRAKHIVNQPVVNEEPSVKLIRHLREEVSRLKAILAQTVTAQNVDRSERVAELMNANQSTADGLTEEWVHQWRTSDAAVQTASAAGLAASSAVAESDDLIPVKEARLSGANWHRDYDSSDALASCDPRDILSESDEEEDWSDDSLDGPYPTRKSKKTRTEGRPPTPPPHKRVRVRKSPSVKPHVRTIFVETPQPTIVVEPPSLSSKDESDGHTSVEQDKAVTITRMPNGQQLMVRLATLIDNLSLNSASQHKPTLAAQCPAHTHHCHHCPHHRHCHHRRPHGRHPDVDSLIRAELLAMRRRMVARTATKKVADSLPHLAQWRTGSMQDFSSPANLPGEAWV